MSRYVNQEMFFGIGKSGQKKISRSSAAVVGVGALGSVVAELLARSGMNLHLIDRDYVELKNLQRQSLFDESDIGKIKAQSAKNKLGKINSGIEIRSIPMDLDFQNIKTLGRPDVILACTDNMESKFLLNDYAKKEGIPMVFGSAVGDKGMVSIVIDGGPCLRCIFKGSSEETCDTSGILNFNSHIVGSMMAGLAIKIASGNEIRPSLIHFDAWKNELTEISARNEMSCHACNGKFDYLEGVSQKKFVRLCGKGMYQLKKEFDFNMLEKKLRKLGQVKRFGSIFHYNGMSFFRDGRIMIKANDEKEAKNMLSSVIGF